MTRRIHFATPATYGAVALTIAACSGASAPQGDDGDGRSLSSSDGTGESSSSGTGILGQSSGQSSVLTRLPDGGSGRDATVVPPHADAGHDAGRADSGSSQGESSGFHDASTKVDSWHGCHSVADCDGGNCVNETCVTATCTDGVEDGTETDVDCGGSCSPCAVGKGCKVAADCTTGGCNYMNQCAIAPSCTQHHGGDTCGAGEDTDLGASPTPATGEESCCTSIAIPNTSYTVDKYLITAGRIRSWVNAFGGNLRSFTQNIPASNTNWNPAWNQYIPSSEDEVDLQLGPYPAPLTPSPYPPSDTTLNAAGEPTGNWLGQWRDGCSMGAPGSPDGARTWWTDHAIGSDAAPIVYPQDYLDDKTINCIDSYMLTAFCIWDGGHLATDAELAAAWGPGPFPWSGVAPGVLIDQNSQEPTGTDSMGRDASSYVVHEFGLSADEFVAPFTYTYDPFNLNADNSVHIGAPGRFPLGAGPYGHMDLAGASYTATAITAGTDGTEPPPAPTTIDQVDHVGTIQGGSWEIHPIISGSGTEVTYDPWMPAYWAYWAMTGRCAR